MIFTPYKDELTIINRIQKVRNTDYVLLRLTSTMIGKNNLDANEYFREMLLNHNIVNYEMLENGGSNGIDFSSILILPNSVQSVKLKFYRVNNARGDRRFSIETIKRKSQNGILNEGDLLYISVYMDEYDQPKIFIMPLWLSWQTVMAVNPRHTAEFLTGSLATRSITSCGTIWGR